MGTVLTRQIQFGIVLQLFPFCHRPFQSISCPETNQSDQNFISKFSSWSYSIVVKRTKIEFLATYCHNIYKSKFILLGSKLHTCTLFLTFSIRAESSRSGWAAAKGWSPTKRCISGGSLNSLRRSLVGK